MDIVLLQFLVLMLFGAHALADYGLQSAHVAEKKVKAPSNPDWHLPLLAHSLMHGFLVGLIIFAMLAIIGMNNHAAMIIASVLAWAETALHFAIDHAKGKGLISYRADQGIHYGCKLAWALIATSASSFT